MDTLTSKNLKIRQFQSGDEKIIKQWLKDFPVGNWEYDGYEIDIQDAISDGNHYMIIEDKGDISIGSFSLTKDASSNKTKIMIGIGDCKYRSKDCLRAIRDAAMQFVENRFAVDDKDIALFFEGRTLSEVLN